MYVPSLLICYSNLESAEKNSFGRICLIPERSQEASACAIKLVPRCLSLVFYPKPPGFKVARQSEAVESGCPQCTGMDSHGTNHCEFSYGMITFGFPRVVRFNGEGSMPLRS